ncbi:putative uncharacterized protein ZNRD1-AS1 [Acomys russatus]|uniref:putative uncharacterized protein ZNRD1-AS1 n=1 Tax=Acomys russatus TaxID=60746 RepID=UPI0021E1E568|nr:putative uncharacterized protein ZNRD1-AS1 [Acomys russatus]
MEGQKCYHWVPEKARKQMERQVHHTSQARQFRNRICRLFPTERLPRIAEDGQTTQRRQQVKKREQEQIRDHQQRMLRGREMIEQRLKDRLWRNNPDQLPSLEKLEKMKKEMKDFESVNAHPLLELRTKSLIKLERLLEMSQAREDIQTTIKPHQKKFLDLPTFLRSHARKIKDQ